ncbi:hypothetical protein PENTCL1PPCAC_8474 [Pristionchus entomophagus]|uniref:Protein kinase domain-containing protein n=1 Tax=Pristionchus entomophagus TaxID=358040 RepID=A0AAV5STU1_9BILA|nr:hypothetical protein PENTCL1PPCAC_8474 [Pristionchus entomophagus]
MPGREASGADFQSKFLNEFTVTGLLGEGGFGEVFEVENQLDCGKYAVKRIAVDPRELETDLREVRAMALLDHPHIIRYHGTWVEKPPVGWQRKTDETINTDILFYTNKKLRQHEENSVFIYIQMQLCKNSLDAWLFKNKTQDSRPLQRMKSWFRQIVSAVEYIHEQNLIHRDLKPNNILFVDEDRLKLCDLGIVTEREFEDGEEIAVTRTYRIGTDLYMSPEQRRGEDKKTRYSSKTDIFTLGLILAEICVPMTFAERSKFFKYCCRGKQSDLITDPMTANFVRLLTQPKPEDRPTCREILNHSFLA